MSSHFKKLKRNFNSIWKGKDKFSQDFTSYLMMNFCKYCQNQETLRWFNKI